MSGRAKKPAAKKPAVKKPPAKRKANGYKMPEPIPEGEILHDTIQKRKWRLGPSIGVGGFGEIYSACDHESSPKKGSQYPYVVKIEPHENGPLFVELHFYIRNGNKNDIANFIKTKKLSDLGMPAYYGHGSHEKNGVKYRFVVLERYGKDLGSLFQQCQKFPPAVVFQLALQMLEVLEYIHSRGSVHADIKGANILLGLKKGAENQAYLVDFGLACKINDKEFKPDPKRAHNGTIEYTSRDAHIGVATMRGDLEILAYNMLHWLVGELPWLKVLTQPKVVQEMKEAFMKNVRSNITKQYKDVPDALIKFFEYITTLKPKDMPDYAKCRQLFEGYLKTEGKTRNSKLDFTPTKKSNSKVAALAKDSESNETERVKLPKKSSAKQKDDAPKVKRGRKIAKNEVAEESDENKEPENGIEEPKVVRKNKRKSTEPALLVNVKKTKLAPRASPRVRKNQNRSTQTSLGRTESPQQVSVVSSVSDLDDENKKRSIESNDSQSPNSSGDIFDDSFVIKEKKVKPKKKLLYTETVTVKKVVRKKVTNAKETDSSWKNTPTIANGRPPPK